MRQYIFKIHEDVSNKSKKDNKIKEIFNRIIVYFFLLELLSSVLEKSKIKKLGIREFLRVEPRNEENIKDSKIVVLIYPKYYYRIKYQTKLTRSFFSF